MHFFISVGNVPPQQRFVLVQTIGQVCHDWFNYTTDAWIVCTPLSCTELDKHLRTAVGPMGYMLMFGAEKVVHAQIPEEAWRWLKRHGLMGRHGGG